MAPSCVYIIKTPLKLQQKHKLHSNDCTLNPRANRVLVRNLVSGSSRLPGEIIQRTGPVSFTAPLSNGRVARRQQDYLHSHEAASLCVNDNDL